MEDDGADPGPLAETNSSKSSSKAAANLCWSTALVIRGSALALLVLLSGWPERERGLVVVLLGLGLSFFDVLDLLAWFWKIWDGILIEFVFALLDGEFLVTEWSAGGELRAAASLGERAVVGSMKQVIGSWSNLERVISGFW